MLAGGYVPLRWNGSWARPDGLSILLEAVSQHLQAEISAADLCADGRLFSLHAASQTVAFIAILQNICWQIELYIDSFGLSNFDLPEAIIQ